MKLTTVGFDYLGLCLEGLFFGFYSGIFAMHWKCSKEGTEKLTDHKRNLTFYALCVLYLLSAAVFAVDIAVFVIELYPDNVLIIFNDGLGVAQAVMFGCSDAIAQFILIHRCWIVWDRNICVVIIPSILAFAYLVMWVASLGSEYIVPSTAGFTESLWGLDLDLTSLTASMTVNALATGLIVFRIFKVFRTAKINTTSDEKSLGITQGGKLRSVIFIIIESGMTLFAVQLARLAITIISLQTNSQPSAYFLIISIHEMLNGITPTIILVRVSMGLSFHDESSLMETVSNLQFAAVNLDPISSMGSIGQSDSLHVGPDDLVPNPGMDSEMRNDELSKSGGI